MEFKFKCKFKFEFKFLYWLVFTPRKNIIYWLLEWHAFSACYRVSVYAWEQNTCWPFASSHLIFLRMLFCELTFFLWVLNSERRWHTQIYNFRYFITSVLICMGRDHCWPYQCCCSPLIGWKVPAIALKVQHCWTLKTTVGDFWRQSPTCPADGRQLKYKYMSDSRWITRLLATVGHWSINQA